MENVSLQFQGAQGGGMLMLLIAGVSLLVVGWGGVQIVRRRWRYGAICLAAAFGALAAVPALVIDGALLRRAGQGRASRTSFVAAGVVMAGVAAAMAMLALAGWQATAFWMAILGIQVVLAVGVFYSAVYSYLGTRRLAALMALRVLAIVALLLILFKPVLSMALGPDAAKPYLPILVDRSGSMATVDQANHPDRYNQALQYLQSQQGRIEKHFRPIWHEFGDELRTVDSLDALARIGPRGDGTAATNIAGAIRGATNEQPVADLAGVLLISDGIHNTGESYIAQAQHAPVPIFTAGVGTDNEKLTGQRNLQLTGVDAPLEAVVNNVATITAHVKITASPGATAQVRLIEGALPPLEQTVSTPANVASESAVFRWTPRDADTQPAVSGTTNAAPPNSNVRRLRVVIPPLDNPAESTTDDNEHELHILMTQPRLRVLYVEGSIRPEYRSLKRLLETDPNVEFMSLIRMKGTSFVANGAIGGKQLASLPTSDADFKLFDVIILGDLDRTFLSNAQLSRLKQFVNDGGGLLMLGGHNSFGPGGYGGTDLEQALPVLVGTRQQPQEDTPFLPQLTAAGQGHPILDGLSGYFPGPGGSKPRTDLPQLPELRGCVAILQAKPSAQVLAVHPARGNDSGPLVVLAAQQYFAGRSVAFAADTTNLWDTALRASGVDTPYGRFWGQLIRWLGGVDSKARAAAPAAMLRTETSCIQAGDAIKLLARVQDAKGQAPQSATVTVNVVPADKPDSPGETITLDPSTAGRGLFQRDFKPAKEGRYILKLHAMDDQKKTLGDDELPLRVLPHSAEMDRLARNDTVLRTIADRSGGRFADITGLPDLIDRIIERQKARTEPVHNTQEIGLYNFTLLFILFVGLLTTEWLLRRNWQLH